MNSQRKSALGRGLQSLIPTSTEVQEGERILEIPLVEIASNPFQPRLQFNQEALAELAESIKAHGVLEPVILRRVEQGYELIAGERRLKAAEIAGLNTIPGVVRILNDLQAAEIALVENIQREDLNPLEEAQGFKRLLLEFNYTQEELGQKVGKSRSHVANIMRLLNLPKEIQKDLLDGLISMGHARALLPLSQSRQFFYNQLVKDKGLNVRQLEQMIRSLDDRTKDQKKKQRSGKNSHLRYLESQIKSALQTKARIVAKEKGGHIEIVYFDEEDLQRIVELLAGEA